MDPLLILRNVKKIYTPEESIIYRLDSLEIFKNINLTLYDGEFISILGKSLSGKSTLTGILSGKVPLTDGEIWFNGTLVNQFTDAANRRLFSKNIGIIYDTLGPYQHLQGNPKELIKQALNQSQFIEEKEFEKEINRWLNYVDFTNNPLTPFNQLRFDDMQKTVIAMIFASNPKLIVADEPTNSLQADVLLSLFEKYNQDHKTSIILLTQIEKEAQRAKRMFTLRDGILREVKN